MTLQEWKALVRGDKIQYVGKDDIWEVNHPAEVSTKKEMMNKYEIVDESGDCHNRMAEHCCGGGGNCRVKETCIIASLAVPNGRGQSRYTHVFDDYMSWTKVV